MRCRLDVRRPDDDAYPFLHAQGQKLRDRRLVQKGVTPGQDEAVEITLAGEPDQQIQVSQTGANGRPTTLRTQYRQQR